ncbi:HAD family phosphatase [Octadecabacter sp. 1_MG-2023]|uniref:HAD family hydrolase n=1 Tax=unclassified Octadecabacter TaxID=196158 RepID=UPI001C08E58D|nr:MULTISPECIES: HAD family phosphatase [unclassified Octadecabacter]MBU2992510.1 HAD family phosphatase [Octadecabacter sp. B2R22]MDO6734733.1 HAD family phosphatase [Octadecabacter sp. 1_MG-2023]
MTIRAVIFDIGNVLIEWQPERFFDRVIGAEKRAEFFAAVPILEMNARVDAGENFHDATAGLMSAYPDWADEISLWRDRWIEMASPAIDHSVRLLRALRHAKVPVFALSNFGVETLEIADREYPFLQEFDCRFISAELGISKPHAEIYERLEKETGLPADSLMFTDDIAENIAAAATRGWKTHLFEGPKGFAERLIAENLITAEAAQ